MSKAPLILSFDTTNETFSIAIAEGDDIKQSYFSETSGMQAELLIPKIEELLKKKGIWYSDLSGIAFTVGPGSFAGLRVGFAVAKALHLATKLPLLGLSCFETLAYPYTKKDMDILVVMDARQKNIFVQRFDSELNPITDSAIIKYDSEELDKYLSQDNKFIVCGSGKNIIEDILNDKNKDFVIEDRVDKIEAENIAKLGCVKLQKKEYNNDVEPLYLRPPRISKRKESK